jgi:hypothetical protein
MITGEEKNFLLPFVTQLQNDGEDWLVQNEATNRAAAGN